MVVIVVLNEKLTSPRLRRCMTLARSVNSCFLLFTITLLATVDGKLPMRICRAIA
jgi:hypothetical protein